MKTLLWLLAMCSIVTTGALAGVNAGGRLIVHSPSLPYTTDSSDYCGGPAPSSCQQAVARIDGPDWRWWTIYAAFPPVSAPRLMGLCFGVTYDKADPWNPTAPDYDGLLLLDYRMCGDFEIADAHWPEPGTGTCMTWNNVRTGMLIECYWFGGYNYGHIHSGSDSPEEFQLIPHPTQEGQFADDSIPAVLDDIAAYGVLGFDTPGYLPCFEGYGACCDPATGACGVTEQAFCHPPSIWHGEWTTCFPNPCPQPFPGACCLPATGACTFIQEYSCLAPGVWLGEWTSCSPNPCPQPPEGACCNPNTGGCAMTTQNSCLPPGIWHGDWLACEPNPCPPPLRACCAPGGGCSITTEANCLSPNVWHAAWSSCSPNPCPQPQGACCYPSGSCNLSSQAGCYGIWHAEWTSCNPNPCPQPPPPPTGACCAPSSDCVLTISASCLQPSIWHGEWTSCDPNPCPVLAVGACCYTSGGCSILTQGACWAVWHPEWTSCQPNPCPQPSGVCCWPTGECEVTYPEYCPAPGVWLPEYPGCDPNPCTQALGACCLMTGECAVTPAAGCQPPAVWHGEYPTCDPNPCAATPTETTTWGRIKDRYR